MLSSSHYLNSWSKRRLSCEINVGKEYRASLPSIGGKTLVHSASERWVKSSSQVALLFGKKKASWKKCRKEVMCKEPALRKLPSESEDIDHWCSSALSAIHLPTSELWSNERQVQMKKKPFCLVKKLSCNHWYFLLCSSDWWGKRLGRNPVYL